MKEKVINSILMQAWKHTALGSFANFSCILIFKIIWKSFISHRCAKNTCPKHVHGPQEIFSQRKEKQKSNTFFLFISQIFFSILNSFFLNSFLSTSSLYSCRDRGCLNEFPQALLPFTTFPLLLFPLSFLTSFSIILKDGAPNLVKFSPVLVIISSTFHLFGRELEMHFLQLFLAFGSCLLKLSRI